MQVAASATGWLYAQRSPTSCVWSINLNNEAAYVRISLLHHRKELCSLLTYFYFFFCFSNLTLVLFCTGSFQAFLSLTNWIQFLSFKFFISFITSFSHLFFGRPLVLIPMGFQSLICLTSFVSFILLRYPHHFILCSFYILNNIFSLYQLLHFFIICYSPFFLSSNWSKHLLKIYLRN